MKNHVKFLTGSCIFAILAGALGQAELNSLTVSVSFISLVLMVSGVVSYVNNGRR